MSTSNDGNYQRLLVEYDCATLALSKINSLLVLLIASDFIQDGDVSDVLGVVRDIARAELNRTGEQQGAVATEVPSS